MNTDVKVEMFGSIKTKRINKQVNNLIFKPTAKESDRHESSPAR